MTNTEKLIEVIENNYERIIDESLPSYRDSIVPGVCMQGWNTGVIIDLDGNIRSFYWSNGTTTRNILDDIEVVAVCFTVNYVFPEDEEEDEDEYYDAYVDYYGRDVAEQSLDCILENLRIDAEHEKEERLYGC